MGTSTVNVNLSPCSHIACLREKRVGDEHATGCSGAPVPVPLSLEPWRSVTMKVVLVECTCAMAHYVEKMAAHQHDERCPGRPVEVTCSIRGETWPESEVVRVEARGWDAVGAPTMLAACRSRWALVKALVLGDSKVTEFHRAFRMVPAVSEMMIQRDVVFAALADVARLEDSIDDATKRVVDAIPESRMWAPIVILPDTTRRSAQILARYVERIIEQVGAL